MKVRVTQQIEVSIDMDFTSKDMEQDTELVFQRVYNKAKERMDTLIKKGIQKSLGYADYDISRNVTLRLEPLEPVGYIA